MRWMEMAGRFTIIWERLPLFIVWVLKFEIVLAGRIHKGYLFPPQHSKMMGSMNAQCILQFTQYGFLFGVIHFYYIFLHIFQGWIWHEHNNSNSQRSMYIKHALMHLAHRLHAQHGCFVNKAPFSWSFVSTCSISVRPIITALTSPTPIIVGIPTNFTCTHVGGNPMIPVYWILSPKGIGPTTRYNSTSVSFDRNNDGTYNASNTLTLSLTKDDDRAMLWCWVDFKYPELPRTSLTLNVTCQFWYSSLVFTLLIEPRMNASVNVWINAKHHQDGNSLKWIILHYCFISKFLLKQI